MRTLAMLAFLLMAGCATNGPTLTKVMAACGYDTKTFLEAWPCVRQGFAQTDFYPDLKGVYIASGDVAAQQVAAGKMTDAEAKLAMADVRSRNLEAARARESNPLADAVVLNQILGRPPVGFTTPAPIIQAPQTVNCYRFGAIVQCN